VDKSPQLGVNLPTRAKVNIYVDYPWEIIRMNHVHSLKRNNIDPVKSHDVSLDGNFIKNSQSKMLKMLYAIK